MTSSINQSTPRVLIVDDEAGIRSLLSETLSLVGYSTLSAENGMQAMSLLRAEKFDLVLLDINMPLLSGFEAISRIKKLDSHLPVIMVSARQDKSDVIEGLKLGADDYISKPFNLEELVMRVNALLRRSGATIQNPILQAGPITLNTDTYEVRLGENLISLSKTEFKLIQILLENKGKVVTKEFLRDAIWGYSFDTTSNVVETYISYLRKKLHTENYSGIKTVRGIGFKVEG
ncbi:MAG: response regulator transcription factor [Candidatus Nanopelagicales bacterium]